MQPEPCNIEVMQPKLGLQLKDIPVVGAQHVRLAVQSEGSIGNAVGHSAHNSSKVRCVVALHA